ncbi:nucleotide exchange factor GrpE [Micromonospora sp. NBC_01699]|uniref:nucleotide exchange factor GrpE n=1 Tax=Micromonospora sp. NBC_01699 TaxID=2975984 RepID=UPI002E307501|nr:nucleotide exchange factor GrpE [Micromonospora sp. NBC_01699]
MDDTIDNSSQDLHVPIPRTDDTVTPDETRDDADRFAELVAVLAEIRGELVRGNERAVARERVIDRLHEENQRLRAGEYRALVRPLVTDLQSLRNDLLRQGAGLAEPVSPRAAANLLASFAFSVELTLERVGVQVLRAEPGVPFEPGTHRAVGVVPTLDPDRDGTVAALVSDGYLDVAAARPLVPASVTVHRFTGPPAEPAESRSDEES